MEFIETPLFEKTKDGIFDEDELQKFQLELLEHPDMGDLIPKGKGLRKTRWAASGRGKRGGARVIYYWIASDDVIFLLLAYKKNRQENLTAQQLKILTDLIDWETQMEEKLFNDLLESVKQMKAIRAGKLKPARTTTLQKNEIMEARRQLKMTQTQFATAFGISVSTLRNWEQGHRSPTGAAVTLIKVARKHPEAVLDAVHA